MRNRAIPRLRFKGFSNEWNYNQLNDLASYIQRGKSPKYGTSKYPVISQKCIGWNHIDINKAKTILPKSLETYSYDRFLQSEDILWNSTGTGTLGRATIVKSSLLNEYKHLVADSHVTVIRLNNAIPEFIYDYIQTKRVQYFILSLAMSGSTNQIELNKSAIEKLNIPTPSLSEQQMIGKFFAKLDKLIQLQQKKVSLLKKLKRGYLQKLFPCKGESVPRLRFKGFHDRWKKSKARDIFKSISEKKHPMLPVLSATQHDGIVYRKNLNTHIIYNHKSLMNYKVVHPSDFVIGLWSFKSGFECSDKLGISSAAYEIFNFINKSNNDTYYWKVYFKTYNFIQLLKKITYGIRLGKSIKFRDFMSLSVQYPSYKEQHEIGIVIKKFNNNLNCQKCKLNHLRKLKKAYLQKMFC